MYALDTNTVIHFFKGRGNVAGRLLFDTLIAATAHSRGAILITHNTGEFARVPQLRIEDWY